jgi:hypothetical protein
MPKVEKLKIFLASPSDVANERRYVEEVIKDINDTVASSKDIVLELVHSGRTHPGYGQDGQAVLNAQIASMEEYALFVGIMWNRVGTPTPRAESGTVEEFERAIVAFERKKQPHIWFYFRQSAAQLNTEEELEQRRQVLEFKKKVQRNALTREYKNPSGFRDRFRKDILLWLKHQPPPTLDRLWEQLVDKATKTDRMKPEIANVLGMWNPAPKVPRGTPFYFVVNLPISGYLVLLEKNPEGQIWCLSPSFLAPPLRLDAGEVKLPITSQDTFTADSVGREQMLAIISQEQLNLDWLPGSDDKPLEIRKEQLTKLLEYLESNSGVQVLYTEYLVNE